MSLSVRKQEKFLKLINSGITITPRLIKDLLKDEEI